LFTNDDEHRELPSKNTHVVSAVSSRRFSNSVCLVHLTLAAMGGGCFKTGMLIEGGRNHRT